MRRFMAHSVIWGALCPGMAYELLLRDAWLTPLWVLQKKEHWKNRREHKLKRDRSLLPAAGQS
jgi:hypothetical protein